MLPSDEDWEGFECENNEFSFATLRKTPKKIELVQLGEEEVTQELRPFIPRKTTIRSKNRRKNSIASVEEIKKTQKDVEMPQPSIFPKNIHIEKLKKIVKLQEHKEEHIPLFREKLHIPLGCTLIYRGFQPTSAEEYFAPHPAPPSDQDNDSEELMFDSRFESGNLDLVFKHQDEYHLQISADTNTKGHRQWFYFSVFSNKTRRERFYIHSFKKKLSLFQIGMRPYGKRRGLDEDWTPVGLNVRYMREDFKEFYRKQAMSVKKEEYFLSFELEMEGGVHYQIASCIPYTSNFLQERLEIWRKSGPKTPHFKYSVMCKSLTGLDVPLITVNETENNYKQARYIIINARTHPGETSSSWVLDGMMEELVNSPTLHKIIQDSNIVLKIIPMLNVEGVYIGNYRTGVVGIDFNRLFLTGKPDVFPEVSALKQLVKDCKAKGRVDLYLDLHGHSILPGCFFYGPDPQFSTKSLFKKISKQLKHSKYFSPNHCIMGSDSSKAETSRIYFQFQQGIYSLTLQNSLGLYSDQSNKRKQKQFESKQWQHFGKELLNSIISIYEQTSFWERQIFRDTRQRKPKYKESYDFLLSSQYEDFSWKKSRTDDDDLSKHIKLLMDIDSEDIDLPNPLSFSQNSAPQEVQSLNDSDNESDNLSEGKHRELMKVVGKVALRQQQRKAQQNRSNLSESPQKQEFRSKTNKDSSSRNQMINTFKQYRFGTEDNTLTEWYTRRRLLSVPRPLKNEKMNQSYIIRRTSTKPAVQDQQVFDSIEITKRIKTEERAPYRKTTTSKFHGDRAQLIIRQKAILEQLLTRKS